MLTLILGKAGTGKTKKIIDLIRAEVLAKRGGSMLIVPEQYSHEAERELCTACGDTMSLYAEVFSFTGLARRIASQQGGGADRYLDKGGRLLSMATALSGVAPRLSVYSAAAKKAETTALLLSAADELKAAGISPEALSDAASRCGGALGAKLADVSLILSAYDAVCANGRADPSDRLTVLARQIPDSPLDANTKIYIDGFTDFTYQEREVIAELLKKSVDLTVCLTVDSMHSDSEIFALSRLAAHGLVNAARDAGEEVRTLTVENPAPDALDFFADNMFAYSALTYGKPTAALRLCTAPTVSDECELAAAKALGLVRDSGCRWRDIAIAVRGFEDYRAALESAFRHYNVPLFSARRSDILSKPLPAMLCLLYEIVAGGWEIDDVVSYMRCGLAGLDTAECDELENYVFKWQLRASAWHRRSDWRQHPDGYGSDYDEAANARLSHINALRRRLADPILRFEQSASAADTASAQAAALAAFFADIDLPAQLARRAELLDERGMTALAEEYSQLWEIITSALEQADAVLGDEPTDTAQFGQLFTRMLSQYDVGTIPIALDRVSAGDFDRMRRRSIKHLIVLGATDDRLPRSEESGGIFSEDERERLSELDIDLAAAGDSELWREFSLIYNCLTLPSDTLTLCCPLRNDDGSECRPSIVFNRAKALFSLDIQRADMGEARLSAAAPALSLAANAHRSAAPAPSAAEAYFMRHDPARLAALTRAADMTRGSLSRGSVEALYGKKLRVSASRADKFASCKFAYFCQYGLGAKPYKPEGFQPPELGTFMHFVLEMTAKDVKALGGFASVTDEKLAELTDKWVSEYVHTELNDFQEKSARFVYLFKRICADVRAVVADMAQELRLSEFEPLEFELDFSKATGIKPPELGGEGDTLMLSGIADRIDGWVKDGRLYLRVVDYKTGTKKFSLSDIWYGMSMQLLMYLMTLGEGGAERFGGRELVPAGVMYVPARVPTLTAEGTETDEELIAERGKKLRRSGIVLQDDALFEAWERGEDKRYIPVRLKGRNCSETFASAERMGLLFGRIRKNLSSMAKELRRGAITADPYFRSSQDNACAWCEYYDACHFSEGENGEKCRFRPRLTPDRVWAMLEGGENDE